MIVVLDAPATVATEERTLAVLARSGDAGARAELIRRAMGLVPRIARKFLGRGLTLDELVSLGNAALVGAVDRFDPDLGYRLGTFVGHRVRGAILDGLRAHRRATRARTNMGATGDEGEPFTWEPADPLAIEAGALAVGSEDRERIARAVRDLDPTASEVIRRRYGFDGEPPMSVRDVARLMGLHRSTVHRIEREALASLRTTLGTEESMATNGTTNGTTNGKHDAPRFEFQPRGKAKKMFSESDRALVRSLATAHPEVSQAAIAELFEAQTGRPIGCTTVNKILIKARLRGPGATVEAPAPAAVQVIPAPESRTMPAPGLALELDAMRAIAAAIAGLDPESADRALAWAAQWKGIGRG